jgi:hypothetical protein
MLILDPGHWTQDFASLYNFPHIYVVRGFQTWDVRFGINIVVYQEIVIKEGNHVLDSIALLVFVPMGTNFYMWIRFHWQKPIATSCASQCQALICNMPGGTRCNRLLWLWVKAGHQSREARNNKEDLNV